MHMALKWPQVALFILGHVHYFNGRSRTQISVQNYTLSFHDIRDIASKSKIELNSRSALKLAGIQQDPDEILIGPVKHRRRKITHVDIAFKLLRDGVADSIVDVHVHWIFFFCWIVPYF
jgi:hypothetical protein